MAPDKPAKITRNLDEAIAFIIERTTKEDKESIKTGKITPGLMHNSFGRMIRNKWGLWEGSVLAKWFNVHKIYHADDMSGIILESVKRTICGEPILLDKQIASYHDYWAKQDLSHESGNPWVK